MWKDYLLVYAEKNFKHPAWGFNHCNRVYNMALDIAAAENLNIDEEIIYAASYMHDAGAFEKNSSQDKDHEEISSELCLSILNEIKFPESKIEFVKEVIEHHMYYNEPGISNEAVIFRDAETLELMGVIGITRILSVIGENELTPDLASAVDLIKNFSEELCDQLITDAAWEIGDARKQEMDDYLSLLSFQTDGYEYL